MRIEIECPHCSRRYTVESNSAGKQVRCRTCQAVFLLPEWSPDPEPAVPMAELIPEPKPAPRPVASRPLPPATPWQPALPDRELDFQPAPRRKPSKPKRNYRPTALEQIAGGLLIAAFVGYMLHGAPNGPFTWAFQVLLVGTGCILLLLAMVRRGSQVGMVFAGGILVLVMGLFLLQLGLSKRSSQNDEPATGSDIPDQSFAIGSKNRPDHSPVERQQEEVESMHSRIALDVDPTPGFIPPERNTAPQTVHDSKANRGAASLREGETELLGGTGGGSFRSVSPNGEPVMGFTYHMGSWDGESAISHLGPLFDTRMARGFPDAQLAREGYGLGALEVDATTYVNAVRPVFMRIKADGQLDPADSYPGEWIGTPTGRPIKTVGGSGAKVIGIVGRRAAVLDAVGLVTERAS